MRTYRWCALHRSLAPFETIGPKPQPRLVIRRSSP
jgi:hypothetical protein